MAFNGKEFTDREKADIIAASRKKNKIVSLLGFAAKAGKLYFGTDRICDEIRRHGVPDEEGRGGHGIVLVSSDASANTVRRLTNACKYYNVTCKNIRLNSAELGEKLGRISECAAVAVFDREFRTAIMAETEISANRKD